MAVHTMTRVMRMRWSGRSARAGLCVLIVVSGVVSDALVADQAAPSKAKSAADSAGEAVRQAVDPDERVEKWQILRRRALDLDFQAWQALVDGNVDEACESKAEELREVKAAYGDTDPWTRVTVWGAESFEALRKLSAEQRELIHQAARSDRLGQRLRGTGSLDRAVNYLRRAVAGYVDVLGAANQITVYGLHRLSEVEAEVKDFESAFSHRTEILETIQKKLDEKNPFAAWASGQMALLEEKMGRSSEAAARWKQIVSALEPLMVDNPQQFVAQLFALAHQHLAQLANDRGEFAEAESHARNAVVIAASECALVPSPETRGAVAVSEIELAVSCAGQGRVAEADRAFDSVLRFMYSNPNEKPPVPLQIRALTKYAEHCRRANRVENAQKLEAKVARLKSDEKAPEKGAERTTAGEEKTTK